MKSCSRAGKGCSQKNPQPISCFHKNKEKKDGLRSDCKSCRRAYSSFAYKKGRVGVKRPVEEGMKWCSRSDKGCLQKNPQSISCFFKNKWTKDGLTSGCKSCYAYHKKREGRVGVKRASARPLLSLEDAQDIKKAKASVAIRRVGVKGHVHLQPSSSSSSSSSDESDESDESEASSSCMNLSNVLQTKKVVHL